MRWILFLSNCMPNSTEFTNCKWSKCENCARAGVYWKWTETGKEKERWVPWLMPQLSLIFRAPFAQQATTLQSSRLSFSKAVSPSPFSLPFPLFPVFNVCPSDGVQSSTENPGSVLDKHLSPPLPLVLFSCRPKKAASFRDTQHQCFFPSPKKSFSRICTEKRDKCWCDLQSWLVSRRGSRPLFDGTWREAAEFIGPDDRFLFTFVFCRLAYVSVEIMELLDSIEHRVLLSIMLNLLWWVYWAMIKSLPVWCLWREDRMPIWGSWSELCMWRERSSRPFMPCPQKNMIPSPQLSFTLPFWKLQFLNLESIANWRRTTLLILRVQVNKFSGWGKYLLGNPLSFVFHPHHCL